ncbi:hypothetical protein K1719_045768 [Acacia pycnantha]|nr:hypothetical protein K1719_045768 [Acacia pycnantha]
MDTLSKESSKSVLEMEQVRGGSSRVSSRFAESNSSRVFTGLCRRDTAFQCRKFPSLKLLGLDDLGGLKSIIVEEGSMPNLKRLIIQRCGSLKQVPFGIEHLSEDHWRVEHVPAVYSTYRKSGAWDVYSLDTFEERDNSSSSNNVATKSHEIRPMWKV